MIRYIVITLMFFTCQVAAQTDSEKEDVFAPQGKWKLEAGLGVDYAIFGARVGRKVYNSLYGVGAVGVSPSGVTWNIGVEAMPKKYLLKYFSPYVRLAYGTQYHMTLTTASGYTETRFLKGPILGLGVVGTLGKKKSYITLGLSYRVDTNEHDRFLEEFNSEFETAIEPFLDLKLTPSLGIFINVW